MAHRRHVRHGATAQCHTGDMTISPDVDPPSDRPEPVAEATAVERLTELDDLDVVDHAPVYDEIHQALRDALTQ